MNEDKSDARLSNLRLVTNRENCSLDRPHYTSKFTGVYFRKERNKYRAQIKYKGKKVNLGDVKSEIYASKLYKEALKNIENGLNYVQVLRRNKLITIKL